MTFAWPWVFVLLPLPWLAHRLLAPLNAAAALRVPRLPPVASGAHPPGATAALWIAALSWLLLISAAARPQMPGPLGGQSLSGRDLMLAFDVSGSMAATDLRLAGKPVSRLEATRTLAGEFLRQRRGDRVGLIVFGSQAFLHTPLSFDLDAVRAALTSLDVGLAGPQTALGDAIALATRHLAPLTQGQRELVLLTDGANTAGALAPARAAWLAQRAGVRIHVVGIGAASARPDGVATGSDGLDETGLQQIAEQTHGSYRRATDSAAIEAFFRRLDQIAPTAQPAPALAPRRELYAWPLALALGLSVAVALRRWRRGPA